MIEFSQNKPRALHVDKLMCSGLLLLFSTQELSCDFNQNLPVQGACGDDRGASVRLLCGEGVTPTLCYHILGKNSCSHGVYNHLVDD